jgi:serine protease inhibitor
MQRMSWIRRVVAGGYLALVLGGCGGDGGGGGTPVVPSSGDAPPSNSGFGQATAVQQAQKADAAVNPAIVAADNAFGLGVLRLLKQPTTNRAISPISIALALQILYNGAAGSTQQGMDQALQLQGLPALQVDQDNAALQASLVDPDPQVQLSIANSLWMHLSANPVLPGFIQTNQTYYAAQIGDLAGAPADINAWVSNATDGLITQALPADFSPARAVLVIANAIYFKGTWTSPFDPPQTAPAPFTRADGTQVTCQMMHRSGLYEYLQTGSMQVIRLPYGQNNRMSMIIVLPQGGTTLDAMISTLTADQLDSWITQLSFTQVALGMPRFTTRYTTSLVPPLTTLGMGVAFTDFANLSGLAPGTYVDFVQHSTVVEVDETGTVAAGSTTVGAAPTDATLTVPMVLDQPFFYAIHDDQTGALLFAGLMFDPTGS